MVKSINNQTAITQLTALWALTEFGLGGIMHAAKIPFTGLFVGGMAVLIIGLLSYFSSANHEIILNATTLVLLIKAAGSPHAPLPAYLAVGFQGVLGALLFSVFKHKNWVCFVFAVICMLESAIQKFLITTIIFGTDFWSAFDELIIMHTKSLFFIGNFSPSYVLFLTVVGIYFVWGIVLGKLLTSLPMQIEVKKSVLIHAWNSLSISDVDLNNIKPTKNRKGLIIFLFTISSIFLFATNGKSIFIRSFIFMMVFIYFLQPLVQKLLLKWGGKKKAEIARMNNSIDSIRSLIPKLWTFIKTQKGYYNKSYWLLLGLFIIALYQDDLSTTKDD